MSLRRLTSYQSTVLPGGGALVLAEYPPNFLYFPETLHELTKPLIGSVAHEPASSIS